jgi:hypothetical protein
LLFGLLSAACGAPLLAADSPVELRWALGALRTGDERPEAIVKDSELESGTRLKFLVEPLSAGSVYLLLLDAEGDLQVLYRQLASGAEDPAYVPAGRQWFQLDEQPGRETFFILASREPLNELDALLAEHEAADAERRRDLSPAIVQEVRRLQKESRQFARAVEKPVMIGGRTRNSIADPETAIDQLAVEIRSDGLYGKTITIDH